LTRIRFGDSCSGQMPRILSVTSVTCIRALRKHWRSERCLCGTSHNFPHITLRYTHFPLRLFPVLYLPYMVFVALSLGVEGDLGRTKGRDVTMNFVHLSTKACLTVQIELRLTQNTLWVMLWRSVYRMAHILHYLMLSEARL
jgi:hypothetical protein